MKFHTTIISNSALLLLAINLGLTNCSSTGMQRSNEANITMETMDNEITLAIVQIDAIGASLEELTRTGQSDVKQAFNVYSDNISKIKDMDKKFARHSDEMNARGKEYFQEWKKEGSEYKNPRIQELSNERRIELENIYNKIAQNSIGVKNAFKMYVTDVEEIRAFLSNDLTTSGINAILPTTIRTKNDGEELKHSLTDIKSAIENARAEMTLNGK